MWPIIAGFVRTYAVYITWPIAAVVGFVGYNIESVVRKDKSQSWRLKSIQERRDERILEEMNVRDNTEVTSLKSKADIPKTILGRNETN